MPNRPWTDTRPPRIYKFAAWWSAANRAQKRRMCDLAGTTRATAYRLTILPDDGWLKNQTARHPSPELAKRLADASITIYQEAREERLKSGTPVVVFTFSADEV